MTLIDLDKELKKKDYKVGINLFDLDAVGKILEEGKIPYEINGKEVCVLIEVLTLVLGQDIVFSEVKLVDIIQPM